MPLLCLVCDTRVEASLVKANSYWCPGCEKELKRDETYKVGKRHFASGAGTLLAMSLALGATLPIGLPIDTEGKERPKNKVSTFTAARKQKRKKLKGLKMKQKRHERRKHK